VQSFLIKTKLQIPPPPPDVLPRRRLIQRLDEKSNARLILVSAPAGYGKTTLLSKWAADHDRPAAWFAIDEGDNDPTRFFTYLISALQNIEHELGQSALAVLRAPAMSLSGPASAPEASPLEFALGALIDDILWQPDPFMLVLDDYHLIRSEPVHQMMRLLLEHLPVHMTLVISAREDPPLNLPRLRARDQLVEITERDLSFTHDETMEFLQSLQLSSDVIEVLETRTEGWAAGLQLAALSLAEYDSAEVFLKAFSGEDRQIADYLFDEVFRHQPAAVQDFLLRTSVLSRLNGALCDAVLGVGEGNEPSQIYLEKLDQAQLFLISLDNKREWYRYHHLFADFLQARLQKERAERLPLLHDRASHWYEEAGDISAAVEHAFQVPDVERVIHLMEQHTTLMVYSGQIATYLSWLERLPQEALWRHPYLCADGSWAYALNYQIEKAERLALAGQEALADMKPFYVGLRGQVITPDEVWGDLLSVQAFCARLRGDSEGVMRYSTEALRRLPAAAYTVRGAVALNLGLEYFGQRDWDAAQEALGDSYQMSCRSGENIYVAIVALAMQGSIHVYRGELDKGAALFQQAIELGYERAPVDASGIPAICLGYRGLTEIHYHRHELAEAVLPLEKALALAQGTGNPDMEQNVLRLRVLLAIQAGDVAQAAADFEESTQFLKKLAPAEVHPDIVALRGELLLAQGQAQTAVSHLSEKGITVETAVHGDLAVHYLPAYVLLGRALLLLERREEALELLAALLPPAEQGQDRAAAIQIYALRAVIEGQKGNGRSAQHSLEQALLLAEPSRFISPFLSVGRPLYDLLRQLNLARDLSSPFAQKVFAALAAQAQKPAQPLFTPTQTHPADSLTRQETQVLHLLARGLSSPEIAAELVIAVSTARSYIKNIHRKLDAHSRDEALAQARRFGFL
jgi:LuxR family transcriptional regulator, maltose regulon positive regulatory protein